MKKVSNILACFLIFVVAISIEAQSNIADFDKPSMAITFTENVGQFGRNILFKTEANGAVFYFYRDEVAYLLTRDTDELNVQELSIDNDLPDEFKQSRHKNESVLIKARFIGANERVAVSGEDKRKFKSNYIRGNNPGNWFTNVASYSAIVYHDIYPGISLKYYGNGKSLKYDFIVRPGADLSKILIDYEGIDNLAITENGDLEISTLCGNIIEKTPFIYQEIDGYHRQVNGQYVINNNSFGFKINSKYDLNHDLTIDPYIQWSTLIGGSQYERSHDVTYDSNGNIIIIGKTDSNDYPLVNPYADSSSGSNDIVITKISSDDSTTLYSTYIGGSGYDEGICVKTDNDNSIIFAGNTSSSDFPTSNAYDDSLNGYSDIIIGKLSSDGSELTFCTYLGGSNSESISDFDLDSENNIYLCGTTNSDDFPVVNAFDSTYNLEEADSYISLLSSSGTILMYSTYLGGSGDDRASAIGFNNGLVYLVGSTESYDFPVYEPFDNTYNGDQDAFIMAFTEGCSTLVTSTYFGGDDEDDFSEIAFDNSNQVYIVGSTRSTDLPVVNAFDDSHNGTSDIVITKWNSSLDSLIYSTFFGLSSHDFGYDIVVSGLSTVFIAGRTAIRFPLVNPIDNRNSGGYTEAFLSEFNSAGDSLLFSTFYGGNWSEDYIDLDINSDNEVILTGRTNSTDFYIFNSPIDTSTIDRYNIFAVKLGYGYGGVINGIVTDSYSNPVSGAYLEVENMLMDDYSDSLGQFSLYGLTDGSFNIIVSHFQHKDTLVSSIPASLNDTTHVEIAMNPGGIVKGVVSDLEMNPVFGTRVTATDYPNVDSTDNSGEYLLSGFETGSYDIRFFHNLGEPGFFDTIITEVSVTENDTTFLNLIAVPEEANVTIWIGNIDESPLVVPIGAPTEINVYFHTQEDVYVGELMFPLGINSAYIDSFDELSCQLHYPLTVWDYKGFGSFNDDYMMDIGGNTWDSYSFWGRDEGPPPYDEDPLHTEPGDPPILGLTFGVIIADEHDLSGQIISDAIGPGLDPVYGPANIGDYQGGPGYRYFQIFSSLSFVDYQYLPGDANMPSGLWPPAVIGADVTYLVNYFRTTSDPCLMESYYAAADINGDCLVIGSDVTRLVNYFRAEAEISWCPDFAPAWPTPDYLPPDAPIGWPNCDVIEVR
ncbi:MAG: hypothetical protein GY839_10285 [candidate division Zixibacteria bacterium]|nr:hypothetical protein [candidate division Zixibacteria bacterium]